MGCGVVFFCSDSLEEDYSLFVVLVSCAGIIANVKQALWVCFNDYMDV